MKIMTVKCVNDFWGVHLYVTSGKGLTDVILKFLERYKFELKHCRGQGYAIAANMKGKSSDLQKRT
jgi:hypothetical protein